MLTQATHVGTFTSINAPDNEFLWTYTIPVDDQQAFLQPLSVHVFTTESFIPEKVVALVQDRLNQANQLLLRAAEFIVASFRADPAQYRLSDDELGYLAVTGDNYPFDLPEFIFYSNSEEWLIRFGEGKFSICDPFGIAVAFINDQPHHIENLENSEPID